MKFPQLPMGQRFNWRGEIYRKTGPMTAHAEADNNRKMIPKSALVEPLGDDGKTTAQSNAKALLEEQSVQAALALMLERLRTTIATLPKEQADVMQRALADARSAFEQRLRGKTS